MAILMDNARSYANMAFASDGKAASEAYKSAKLALETYIAEGGDDDETLLMLRDEVDSCVDECAAIYSTCEREAREHYD